MDGDLINIQTSLLLPIIWLENQGNFLNRLIEIL